MKSADAPHFVWVRGMKGPTCQKWAVLNYGIDTYWKERVIRAHPISEAEFENASLDDLAKRFPPPEYAE